MGCDIHLHIELKIDGRWHHYGAPDVARNYELFGKLAGVRNTEVTPISPPKGLPGDLTLITQLSYAVWKPDAHSMSWLGTDEIMQLEDWCYRKQAESWSDWALELSVIHTYLGGSTFTGWKKYPADGNPFNVEDVRFVFWFDN